VRLIKVNYGDRREVDCSSDEMSRDEIAHLHAISCRCD